MAITANQQHHLQRVYTGNTAGSSLSISWTANTTDILVYGFATPCNPSSLGSITSNNPISIYNPTLTSVAHGIQINQTASGLVNPWTVTTPGFFGQVGITGFIAVYVIDASTNSVTPQSLRQANPYYAIGTGTTAASNAAITFPVDTVTNYKGFSATLQAFGYSNANGPGIWGYGFGVVAFNNTGGFSLPASCPLQWYFLFGDSTLSPTGRAVIGNFTEGGSIPYGREVSTITSNNSIIATNVLVNMGPAGSPAAAFVEVRPPMYELLEIPPVNNPVWIN